MPATIRYLDHLATAVWTLGMLGVTALVPLKTRLVQGLMLVKFVVAQIRHFDIFGEWGARNEAASVVLEASKHFYTEECASMYGGGISHDNESTLIVVRGTFIDQLYVDDILRLRVESFLKGLPGAIFQRNYARPHSALVQDFLSHGQILSLPISFPELPPFEHWRHQLPPYH
ncbi:hypothetical protein TNCV_4060941 [Trichonephila clavipes]|nr:hypothetical protein TNCV_4060941 [Trichonephila clavipes]